MIPLALLQQIVRLDFVTPSFAPAPLPALVLVCLYFVVLLRDHTEDFLFTRLLLLAAHKKLIQYIIGFMKVEDDVELTDLCQNKRTVIA